MSRRDIEYPENTPDMPDNAEESIKCPQCGNLVGITEFQAQQAVTCPICGTTTNLRLHKKFGGSNEEY
ncbi:MAG TPA: hypothetical protein GX509_05510 [Firmicutes bacterium]|nr:hypothetical protein [Bacillota bacterium]HHY98176.1 hypothetical protein [Bacillota bacterium]